jgi:hypothetical protein
MLILSGFRSGIEDAPGGNMHVRIVRLYDFVQAKIKLTENEQSHLTQCSFCVMWLDALRRRKAISQLTKKRSKGARIG